MQIVTFVKLERGRIFTLASAVLCYFATKLEVICSIRSTPTTKLPDILLAFLSSTIVGNAEFLEYIKLYYTMLPTANFLDLFRCTTVCPTKFPDLI